MFSFNDFLKCIWVIFPKSNMKIGYRFEKKKRSK